MLTREQILTVPAEQLAEVSARMMGRPFKQISPNYFVIDFGYPDGYFEQYGPHVDYKDARLVAEWVMNWTAFESKRMPPANREANISRALEEIGGSVWGWAWTPEQLTRASLLAFVDNGGEV